MQMSQLKTIGVPLWAYSEMSALRTELVAFGAENLPEDLRDLVLSEAKNTEAFTNGMTVGLAARVTRLRLLELKGRKPNELPAVNTSDESEEE